MPWTIPRTWSTDELVTASMMNTNVRDNLNHLLNGQQYAIGSITGQVDTTSASFGDVAGLSLAITPVGNRVGVMAFVAGRSSNTAQAAYYRLLRLGGGSVGMTASIYGVDSVLLWATWVPLTPGVEWSFGVQMAATNGYAASVNYSTGTRLSWIMAWEF